jgi:DNA topoisomerase I
MAKLLLIESPGKVKKLSQILGPGWMVKASMGHIRELTNEGEDALGFELAGDRINCHYAPRDPRAQKVIATLKQAVKQADQVYIATDPDREGETIGWHLQQALRLKSPHRVVYREITPSAVRQAVANPGVLDEALIAAGRARDCLDKLVGYKGSRHVVWPLNNGAKSMGRVQSAALHLLCQREQEIQTFVPQNYWSVWVSYQEGFKAFYRQSPTPGKANSPQANSSKAKGPAKGLTNGTSKDSTASKTANQPLDSTPDQGADNDADETQSNPNATPESERVSTQAEADRLLAIARTHPHQVLSVEGKLKPQSPPPPFITSTLQQAAGAKLRFSPDQTMKVAQSLYEAGHITYMRTDSVTLAPAFCDAVRTYLSQQDPTNLPTKAAQHRAAKSAQAAHEAIRPTHVAATPEQLANALTPEAAKLYTLIWNRAIASQCRPAQLRKTRIVTQSGELYWEARGQVVEFAGYSRYWNNISADAQLPQISPGQSLTLEQAQADPKQTQPPPRYSEPKLVQLMERKGIGRPSTYAPTIKTLRTRTYVELIKGKLQPTPLGLALDAALATLLPDLIEPEFTAQMESVLDAIAAGQQNWQTYLTSWHRQYFAPAIAQAKTKLATGAIPAAAIAIAPHTYTIADPITDKTTGHHLDSQSLPASRAKGRTRTKTQASSTTSRAKNPRPKAQSRTAEGEAAYLQSGAQSGKPRSSKTSLSKTRSPKTQSAKTQSTKTQAISIDTTAFLKSTAQKATSAVKCPNCQQFLNKVSSRSQKLKADHFLKCSDPSCDTVMFWNPQKQGYELPYAKRPVDPQAFTDSPCPSCGALLIRHPYQKDGQDKIMLRCSLVQNRQGKCKEVAFFQTREGSFWSPKYGNLKTPNPSNQ